MNKTVDSSIVKLTNYRSVWGYIHKNKQATIPQISKDIGLSLPTVTRAVDYGVAEGIIEPDGGTELLARSAAARRRSISCMPTICIFCSSILTRMFFHTESTISEAVL